MASKPAGDAPYWGALNAIRDHQEPWTRSRIIRTLRKSAAMGRPVTAQLSHWISLQGAAKRLFGSLEAACRVAGVEGPKRKAGKRRA